MLDAQARCRTYRKRILEISQQVTALHVAPAFSCMEIVDLIYHELKRPQDVFLMSKGHGCMAQYVILEDLGVLSKADLDAYCRPGGRLGAHPDYGVPGIAASTGSLGHGLGIAVGQAYAEKLKGSDVTVYCLLSDGEFQEGSTWEAVMMAAKLELGNLVCFVDKNGYGGLERISDPIEEPAYKFGWNTCEASGHDQRWMRGFLREFRSEDAPFLMVCDTIKGKGVSFMEDAPIWHYRSPSPTEYQQALAELDAA